MFSIRKNIGGNRHWDKNFIIRLLSDMKDAGYESITFKLPVNRNFAIDSEESLEQIKNKLRNSEIGYQQFLDSERNYSAVILVAKNKVYGDIIKILFVNISKNTHFLDDSFPSGNSIPSQIFIQSNDPARLYGLVNYFYSYLTEKGTSNLANTIYGLLSLFLIGLEFVNFVTSSSGFFQKTIKLPIYFDISIIIISIYLLSRFFSTPLGLSINKRETATLPSYIKRIINGDFRDNPVANVLLTIIIDLIVAGIVKLIGW